MICCESPFFNRFQPSAYGPLVEMVFAIRTASLQYDVNVPFITYSPSEVKKALGAGHAAKKEIVKASLMANPELNNIYNRTNRVTMQDLDEHSIDAIGVAYSHLALLRLGKIC